MDDSRAVGVADLVQVVLVPALAPDDRQAVLAVRSARSSVVSVVCCEVYAGAE